MSKKCITAFAWSGGLIEFGYTVPDGALPVITGPERRVREVVEVLARHSRTEPVQLLVPGVPEAADEAEARAALIAFCRQVRTRIIHPNRVRKMK